MMANGWILGLLFGLATLGSLAIARRSLLDPKTHGFYRFFAFEAIFGLILANADAWFVNPLALRQIVSWVLLAASFGLAIYSYILLRSRGEAVGGIEHTSRVVATGVYRLIRHPLYASLALFACGAMLKRISTVAVVLTVAACAFLVLTALTEERENLRKFGPAYAEYLRSTRRFIPFVF